MTGGPGAGGTAAQVVVTLAVLVLLAEVELLRAARGGLPRGRLLGAFALPLLAAFAAAAVARFGAMLH